ncbi:type II secretion system protein [bacterium]|nr:type II secretion system protein [bacterium]
MNKELRIGVGVKSSCSNGFDLVRDTLVPIAKKTQKIVAFTLAETLIVIGVIGIVSALTLPNLNNTTGDKEKVAKVKKVYQNLNDALGRAEAVYGPYSDWFINDGDNAKAKAKRAGERITEFMKVSKTCGTDKNSGCFNSGDILALKNGNGELASPESFDTVYKIITADGTSIAFVSNATVRVDIDGPTKGKNTFGYDFFEFNYDNERGYIPENFGLTTVEGLYRALISEYGGQVSASWIINYDNADYLEFAKTSDNKCKNGTTPTEANPRCK